MADIPAELLASFGATAPPDGSGLPPNGVPQPGPDPSGSFFQPDLPFASPQAPPPPEEQLPPPPPNLMRIDPDPADPPKVHVDFAKTYVPAQMKRSVEFIKTKTDCWQLLEDLYWNRRPLNEWSWRRGKAVVMNRTQRANDPDPTNWQSQQTIAVAPFVDTYAQQVHSAIFSNEEWLQVRASPRNQTGSVEDIQFPTAKKLQQILLDCATDMNIRSRLYEFVLDGLRFGTAVAKTPWYSKKERQTFVDLNTGEISENPQTIRRGTALDLVNLSRFLPDPDAESADVDRWQFVGDRSECDYHTLKDRFTVGKKTGVYNLGYDEFMQRWPERGDSPEDRPEKPIKDDPARLNARGSEATALQVWDYHGRIPFADGIKECVCTFITGLHADSPEDAVLVRLTERAAIAVGKRPYIAWHFLPTGTPLGMGIIEQNLDLIYLLSRTINSFIDAVRLVSIPTPLVRENSPLAVEFEASQGGNVWYPGKPLYYRDKPDEIQNFSLAVADLGSILNLIQYLDRMLEKRTSVSDANRGVSETRKTATEVSTLQQNAARPMGVILTLVNEAVLLPYGKIALSQIQSNIWEDQPIFVKGPNGIPTPTVLTVQELRTGEYIVKSALQDQDAAKISKAQTIMQALPIMEQVWQPLLMFENKQYLRGGLIEAMLSLLGITDYANVLTPVDEMAKQQILMAMNPGPPPGQQGAPSGQPPQPNQEGAPPPQQQEQPPGALTPGTAGGPAGPMPTDLNEILQMLQYQGMLESPVPPGGQGPAG